MNRAQRRANSKARQAISTELVRMEKPEAYRQGYMDGGNAMVKACYAATASGMVDLGFSSEMICQVLRGLDERLMMYSGDEEMQHTTWTEAGLEINFDEPFTEERIQVK